MGVTMFGVPPEVWHASFHFKSILIKSCSQLSWRFHNYYRIPPLNAMNYTF